MDDAVEELDNSNDDVFARLAGAARGDVRKYKRNNSVPDLNRKELSGGEESVPDWQVIFDNKDAHKTAVLSIIQVADNRLVTTANRSMKVWDLE